jgi:hypothetical protein
MPREEISRLLRTKYNLAPTCAIKNQDEVAQLLKNKYQVSLPCPNAEHATN